MNTTAVTDRRYNHRPRRDNQDYNGCIHTAFARRNPPIAEPSPTEFVNRQGAKARSRRLKSMRPLRSLVAIPFRVLRVFLGQQIMMIPITSRLQGKMSNNARAQRRAWMEPIPSQTYFTQKSKFTFPLCSPETFLSADCGPIRSCVRNLSRIAGMTSKNARPVSGSASNGPTGPSLGV